MTAIGIKLSPPGEQVRKELAGIRDELKIAAVKAGLRSVGKFGVGYMRGLSPVHTGKLKGSLASGIMSRREKGIWGVPQDEVGVRFGTRRKVSITKGKTTRKGYYDYLVRWFEMGTKPHDIPKARLSKRGGAWRKNIRRDWTNRTDLQQKATLKIGGRFVSGAKHPGMKPYPFVSRTKQAIDPQIESKFYQGLAAHLDKLKRAAR